MTAGENVSAEDLRQDLAEVEGKKPTQRLMAAINYLEDDDLTQKEVAERYGYTGGWLSQWLDRLERLAVVTKVTFGNRVAKNVRRALEDESAHAYVQFIS